MQTIVSVSQHYKNPTKQTSSSSPSIQLILAMKKLKNCLFGIKQQSTVIVCIYIYIYILTFQGIGCYMFRIDDTDVVDATLHGSAARFINHSCEVTVLTFSSILLQTPISFVWLYPEGIVQFKLFYLYMFQSYQTAKSATWKSQTAKLNVILCDGWEKLPSSG